MMPRASPCWCRSRRRFGTQNLRLSASPVLEIKSDNARLSDMILKAPPCRTCRSRSLAGRAAKPRSRRSILAVHEWTGFAVHRWTAVAEAPKINEPNSREHGREAITFGRSAESEQTWLARRASSERGGCSAQAASCATPASPADRGVRERFRKENSATMG